MSGVGANTTQLAKWLGAEDGKMKLQRTVKNPTLEKFINQGMDDYSNIRGAGNTAFDKYFADYMADAPAAGRRSAQEIGVIDRFYDPTGVEADLTGLRNRRKMATRNAAELASLRAIRGQNQSRLLGSGGPSSYDTRQRMRFLGDIGVNQALDETGQERSDYDYLMNQRLGLGGRRQAMMDARTGRVLAPEAIRRNMYGQNLGYIGSLGDLDRANTFYGLKYDPSFAEELGTAFDNSISTMKDIYGMGMMGGGGMGGGGGGGGAKNAAQTYGGLYTGYGGYGGNPGWGHSAGDWANEGMY